MTQKNTFTKDVTFLSKQTCYIEDTVKIGKNVIIYPNNVILGNTIIGDNVVLKANNYIQDCTIGNNCVIDYSYLEQSVVQNGTSVGPFSRLRPNSHVGSNCKIGNFVEIKNSTLGDGTKASHLAYVGDSTVGNNCNIGCGAIFVNYNGREKNSCTVGNNCFIGSNVNLVAPLNIADNTYICAGTTVTESTQTEDFVIGRAKQTVKPKRAKNYLKEQK